MRQKTLIYLLLLFFKMHQAEISKLSLSIDYDPKYVDINLTIDNSVNGMIVNFYEDQKDVWQDLAVIFYS